jgi:hypothetical protein
MAIATRGVVPGSSSRQRRREALLEAQRRSGLSLAAFCRPQGLRKGTLSFWKWKLAREAEAHTGRRHGVLRARSDRGGSPTLA